MGILDEFKKLMFGAKAVSKSAAEKAKNKGKEAGDKIKNESEELWEVTKERADDLGKDVQEKATEAWERTKDSTKDIREDWKEKSDDAKDFAEDIGRVILDKTEDVAQRAKDLAEDVGEKILKKRDEFIKREDAAEDLSNEKTATEDYSLDDLFETDPSDDITPTDDFENKSTGDSGVQPTPEPDLPESDKGENELIKKARKVSDRMSELLDDTLNKAKKMSEEESKAKDYKSSPTEDLKKDLLDKDDFFRKADAFAEGRYHDVRDSSLESVKKDDAGNQESGKGEGGNVPGFEDLDGDGNEIIDDAFIVSDEEE